MDDTRTRDLIGYGRRRPQADWPHKARIALSFVLNYEEGGEHNVMDGDPHAEIYVTPEMTGMPLVKRRHFSSEEMFEYGPRRGTGSVHRLRAEP
jgi:allantoinase